MQIADEAAIIAWDEAGRREHFVRRASFRGGGSDFGFLVPTPTQPELGEVEDAAFARLEDATKPEIVERDERRLVPTLLCAFPFYAGGRSKSAVEAAAPRSVRVLDTAHVGGFDAVVLEADDAGALAKWLTEHGYAQRPELAAWLAPYVQARWKLTAFKVTGDPAARRAETAAVRMSFGADRPFFPYREPSDQRENLPAGERQERRMLRVFFLSSGKVDGSIGPRHDAWRGRVIWSDHVDAARVGGLPFATSSSWLTVFEDTASPRPGTDDLFFAPAADTTPVRPPPIVHVNEHEIPVPLDVFIAVIGGAWWIVRRIRRRRASARARDQSPESGPRSSSSTSS